MRLEIKNEIRARKILVLVINKNGKVYQIHRITSRSNEIATNNVVKVIDVKEEDTVVEYGIKYDFKTKRPLHVMQVIYHPKTMNYMDATKRAKSIVEKYLNEQVKMGVDIYKLMG
jgi:hypothetical protein